MIVATLWVFSVLAITSLAAPAYEDYYELQVPQKRAALVLDRLLVALQHALHDDEGQSRLVEDGPRAAPLRVEPIYTSDMSPLQRRGQESPGRGRGRVLRCYFNAITCF